jgi:hypothetical protein
MGETSRNTSPSPSSVKTGLLLIKIGFVLVFVIPLITIFIFGSFVGQFGFFQPFSGFLFAITIAIISIGGTLSLAALKFGNDVVRLGQKNKADYVIILGIVVFLVGSNIAGILIAIGGYLIRKQL